MDFNFDSSFKSGFIAVIGKPNAGKSTLINRIVGTKVAITSSKPQTTRHRILGVKSGDGWQMVFVDTPGVHKPKHELGKFMEKTYKSEAAGAEMAIFIADATYKLEDEDKRAAEILFRDGVSNIPVFLVINKIDKAKKERLEQAREEYPKLGNFYKTFEISALKGTGVAKLEEALVAALPPGPPYFPEDMSSDQSPEFLAAEVVREKLLKRTKQEVPHSIFVHTETMREGETPDTLYFDVRVYIERESQKGIIIGKGGKMLKKVGTMAREELELLMGKKVFLDIWVKVKEDWKDRKDLLKSWGYEI